MAERASIFEVVQLGVESAAGTKVAATKRLSAMEMTMGPRVDISKYRPSGNKFATVAAMNKEWVEGSLSGAATYTEIIYPLSSVLKTATPTGTTAKTWAFAPAATAADTKKTFTFEQGSAVRGHRFGYGMVTGLGLKFSRSGVELSGSVLGQALEDGFTMTSSGVTDIALMPVLATQVQVYLADSAAGLDAASALERAISAEWNIADRFGPAWFLDGTSTFGTDVEIEPKLECKLTVEADAAGMALLTNMRAGSFKFMRIEAVGAEIEVGTNYTLTIDTACKVMDVGDFSDEDGVYAIEWQMEGFYDSTWTKATEVTVINEIAAL